MGAVLSFIFLTEGDCKESKRRIRSTEFVIANQSVPIPRGETSFYSISSSSQDEDESTSMRELWSLVKTLIKGLR